MTFLFFACASLAASAQFAQPTAVPTYTWPQNVQAAQFLPGKAPGLAYLEYEPPSQSLAFFQILLNDGAGTFTSSQMYQYGVPNSCRAYALGDTRGTGLVDTVSFISPTTVLNSLGFGGGGFTGAIASPPLSSVGPQTPAWTYASLAKLSTSSTVPAFFAEDTANQTLSVIRNDNGSFSTVLSTISLANDGTGEFLLADLNGDGNMDILVLNGKSHIATPYYGRGDGTFLPAYAFTLPNGVFSMQVADLDGDGRPELLLSDSNGALFFFQNTASYGLLSTAVPIGGAGNGLTGNGGHLIAVADLNGDGLPDIVTETPAGISVLLGQRLLNNHLPQYNVALKAIYNGGPGRSSAVLADFNADGKLDLALDSPEGIAILYGNGDGSFATSLAYAAGQPAYDVALGGFTATGHLDAVLATGIPQIQLLNGDGKGAFAATLAPAPAGAAQTNVKRTLFPHLATGDFDGDGRLDVAITLDGQPPLPYDPTGKTTPDGLTLQFGNGDGTFSAPVAAAPLPGSPHYGFSAVGDFNGDGVSDIANIDVGFEATYLGGAAARSGSMAQSVFYADTSNDSVNFDEDAYDLVATGFLNPGSARHDILYQDDGEFFVYQNNGDDTFSPAATDQVPVITAPSNYVSVDASTSAFPSTGIFPTALKLYDLDQDGYGDAVILYHNLASDPAHPTSATPNTLSIYWGEGNRNFAAPTVLTLSRNYYELAMVDVDGDGKPDLVLSDGNLIAVLYNLGNRTFGNEQHFLAGQGINLVASGDVNHDGAQDLVAANGGTVLSNPVVTNGALPYTAELNTGGITVLLNGVRPHAVTGGLTVSPEPSAYGQSFTITATITQPSGATAPGGSVSFSVDGQVVGSGTVANNQASYTVASPAYAVGKHAIAATYSGDSIYSAASFSGSHQIVGLPSSVVITNLLTPIYYGQEIAFTNGTGAQGKGAQIDAEPEPGVAGGEEDLYLDGTLACMAQAGAATVCNDANFTGFNAGTHNLVATYAGNQVYAASLSPTYPVVILRDDTVTALQTSLTPAALGTAVTFTATLTAAYAMPAGPVLFYDGTTQIGTGALSAKGMATFTTASLAAGTHTITASYAQTTNFNASQSSTTQVILPAGATASGPNDFTLTVSQPDMSIGVGNTGTVLVTVTTGAGFTEPVALSCSPLPWESTCTFATATIPSGGGSTQLAVHVEAPHDCSNSTQYFVAGGSGWIALGLGAMTALLLGFRRRKLGIALLGLLLCLLPTLGGCGSGRCTDLGTRPGNYTFTVTGTAVGSNGVSHSVSMRMWAFLDGETQP